MQNFLATISLLLAQTAQEKKLTALYLSLFAFLLVLLIIDSREMKKWVGGNKTLSKIIVITLIIVIIAFIVVYFILK